MKSIFLLVIFVFVLYIPVSYAGSYRLAVGKILYAKQNKAKVEVFSKICTGEHLVTIKNADKIQTNSVERKNVYLLINDNCSKVFLINTKTKKGGVQ